MAAPAPKGPKGKSQVNPRILALLGIVVVGAVAYYGGNYYMQMQQAAVAPPPAPAPAPVPATPATKPAPAPAAKPPAKPAVKPAPTKPTATKPATQQAAKPPVPATTASQAAKAGEYAIQVHTLYKQTSAVKATEELKAKGFDAYFVEKTVSTEKMTLQVTGYKTQEDADADAATLKSSKTLASPVVQKIAEDQYVINAGTYSKVDGTAKASKLKLLGYSVASQVSGQGNVQVYMVRVGHFASKADAQASPDLAKLKELKFSPIVVTDP